MRLQTNIDSADYTGLMPIADVKEYIRFDGTDQDTVLPTIIQGSINLAEGYTQQSFGNKVITAEYSEVCAGKKYRLPFGYHRDVTSVTMVALDGTETLLTLGVDYYITGLNLKNFILVNYHYSDASYRVVYEAGPLDPSTVDNDVKNAIYKIISDSFENRENSITVSINSVPQDAIVLLGNHRLK